jgi:hypothetical protein
MDKLFALACLTSKAAHQVVGLSVLLVQNAHKIALAAFRSVLTHAQEPVDKMLSAV